MNGSTDIHPHAVLESLLTKGSRSNRRANLEKMYELCRKQHESGSKEFSLSTIGRLAETDGIMKGVHSTTRNLRLTGYSSKLGPLTLDHRHRGPPKRWQATNT